MIRGTKRSLPNGGRIIEPKVTNINVPINASLHNRFDIEVVDAKTGEIKQRAQAENIICNQLWNRLFTPNVYWANVHYGTGNGTPDVTDVSLFNFYASLTHISTIWDSSRMLLEGVLSLKRQYQILESAAVGQTITEVGIAYGTSANNLCTHAMLKDMNGNQISIVKTDTDLINIYATIFVHFLPSGYDSGHIRLVVNPYYMLEGFTYWLTTGTPLYKISGIEYRYGLFPIGHGTGRLTSNYSNAMTSQYSAVNKTLKLVGDRIHINIQNYSGGSQCIRIAEETGNEASYNNGGARQVATLLVGGEWYPGTSILQESIGTGDGVVKDFTTNFNYATEAVLYVDGQIVSGVVVDNVPHKVTNGLMGFNLLLYGVYVSLNPQSGPGITSPITGDAGSASNGANVCPASIFENRLYGYGISQITLTNIKCQLELSDDLSTWVTVPISTTTVAIPAEHRTKRYWRLTALSTGVGDRPTITGATFNTPPPTTNIHFDVAPAAGAVITADYFTKTIAKDVNHVFDLTVTIQLGEYTET